MECLTKVLFVCLLPCPDGNGNERRNMLWNPEKSIFEVGHESNKDLVRAAYGTISSRWIVLKCWKYL